MNARPILLLTLDSMVEEAMAEALLETDGIICIAHTADDALRIVCSNGSELELAVIDFDHGSHGMTFISASNTSVNTHSPMRVLTPPPEEPPSIWSRAK